MRTDAQFHAAIVRLTVAAEVVWMVGALLMVLLLTGCATGQKAEGRGKNEETNQMLLPPLPRATRSGAGSEVGHVAGAIAPPVGPRTLRLEWDKGDPNPETVTQLWQSPEVWTDPPEVMIAAGVGTMVGEFSEPRCELPATGERMFYIIRNRLGAEFSDWARK